MSEYAIVSCDQIRYSAGRVIGAIRSQGVKAVLTFHGQPVAEIVPLTDEGMAAWADHNATPAQPAPAIPPLNQANLEQWQQNQNQQEESNGSEIESEPANES